MIEFIKEDYEVFEEIQVKSYANHYRNGFKLFHYELQEIKRLTRMGEDSNE
jgi:hypothetical protein